MMRARVPWYVWTAVASVTCILVGGYWDISWHMTIGRDTFWTPAHIAIQLGGIIAGGCGAYVIIATTLGRPRAEPGRGMAHLREVSVSVWGFRAPLGAFVAVWGAAAMVISAPFDNWWHKAYGLDVKILSPPHMVLTIGILGVALGAVLIITASLNRARGPTASTTSSTSTASSSTSTASTTSTASAALSTASTALSTASAALSTASLTRKRLELCLLVVAGEILVLGMTAILEHTFRSNLHRADAYQAISIVAPLVMLTFARTTNRRFAATTIATSYTVFMIAMLWLFPLFPAEPKLGPVYQPITHFIPEQFPMLIVVPAFACDLVLARTSRSSAVDRERGSRGWPRYAQALLLGPIFVVVLVAAQWPFADFLMSPYSKNWVFGTHYEPYFMHPDWYSPQNLFIPGTALAMGLIKAAIAATLASYLGLLIADGLRKVKR